MKPVLLKKHTVAYALTCTVCHSVKTCDHSDAASQLMKEVMHSVVVAMASKMTEHLPVEPTVCCEAPA